MPRYLVDWEVVAAFGNPKQFLDIQGNIKPEWEGCLVFIKLPAPLPLDWEPSVKVTSIRCHMKIAVALKKCLDKIFEAGLWKYIKGFNGCYNFRTMRTSGNVLSRHSWGIAIDLDCVNFIPPDWLRPILGKFILNEPPPPIVKIFSDNGFVWGKNFPTSDPMHFEIGGI
jgi:hypothetical protein